jgi:hypothetical protein
MTRVIVHLSKHEWDALRQIAERDLRGLREQARYFIVKGLASEVASHVSPADAPAAQPQAAEGVAHD